MVYRSSPISTKGLPPGIPYIVGNELAERFSFYGMRSILLVYMTNYLCQSDGKLDVFGNKEAEAWVHLFPFKVGDDKHCVNFPYLDGILAGYTDDKNRFDKSFWISILAILISVAALWGK